MLCLAGDRADQFSGPEFVDGVHVVPVGLLSGWLQQQPQRVDATKIATEAVRLSCRFPPAIGPGLTLGFAEGGPAEPLRQPTRHVRQPSTRFRAARPALRRVLAVAALLVGTLLLPAAGARVGHLLSNAFKSAVPQTTATTASKPVPQALDDWRIRAGLYAANDEPAALRYVPDAGLGSWSDACRKQRSALAPYRDGLLRAPDKQLAAAARTFDVATTRLLRACIKNDPVAVHHARDARSHAADAINVRYNTMIGTDPQSYLAVRVV